MSKKILLVDDSDHHRLVIQKILNGAGYEEIFFAENGNEALEKAAKIKPDMVITDTLLPDFNGFEISRQIKMSDENIKVIMITGLVNELGERRLQLAKEAGADRYVLKTYDYSDLIDAVNELFE